MANLLLFYKYQIAVYRFKETMISKERVIGQTIKWITEVVIKCNFCPFASKTLKQNTIQYRVENSTQSEKCLEFFLEECEHLNNDLEIETILLIFPNAFQQFDDYLDLVSHAEKLLVLNGYEGIYQVASFHPHYRFEGTPLNDAANYTNRSLYPMLHLLREDSMEKALDNYPGADNIPDHNIRFAREKGLAYMKLLRDSCL